MIKDLSLNNCCIHGLDPRANLLKSLWQQYFLSALQAQLITNDLLINNCIEDESLASQSSEICHLTIGLRMKNANGETVSFIIKQQLSKEYSLNSSLQQSLPALIFQSWLKTWEHSTEGEQHFHSYVVDHLLQPKSNEIELYLSIV